MNLKILAILQKEVRIFFNSFLGFIFLIIFVGLHSWLFFKSFFLIGQSSMDAFFSILPWTLLFLVPSISMRIWAEEYRQGTIEILLTSGTPIWRIILSKFLSGAFLLLIALILTLPIAYTVIYYGNPDIGIIITSYIGALLLGMSYLAIGQYISSITKNQMVAFLLSIFVCFLFYIIGEPVVTTFLPTFLTSLLQYIGIGNHYYSTIIGVIDTRDIFFYLCFIFIFLYFNYLSLKSNYKSKKINILVLSTVFIVAIFAVNLLSSVKYSRFDFTEDKIYTFSDSTKKILSSIEKPVKVKVFLSNNLPPQAVKLSKDLKNNLSEFYKLADGNFELEYIDPIKNEEYQQLAAQFGISHMNLQLFSNDKQERVSVYISLAIVDEDKNVSADAKFEEKYRKYEVISDITSISGLELEFVKAIKKVSSKDLKKAAILDAYSTTKVVSGINDTSETESTPLLDVIKGNYDVEFVELNDKDTKELDGIDTLFIIGIKENLSNEIAEKIIKFVENGGNLVFLADKFYASEKNETMLYNTDFSNLLNRFGISISNNIVVDKYNVNATFKTQFGYTNMPYVFFVNLKNFSNTNIITKKISSLVLPWTSYLEIKNIPDVSITTLAKTSRYSSIVKTKEMVKEEVKKYGEDEDKTDLITPEIAENIDKETEKEKEFVEVLKEKNISLNPDQNFDFTSSETNSLPVAVLAKGQNTGQVFVMSNSRFLNGQFIGQVRGNYELIANLVDYFSYGDDFITIRSKVAQDRPIEHPDSVTIPKFINTILIPVLILVTFFTRIYLRNRKKHWHFE